MSSNQHTFTEEVKNNIPEGLENNHSNPFADDFSLLDLSVQVQQSSEKKEILQEKTNLKNIFLGFDEVELLVGRSTQGQNELRNILFDIYSDLYLDSETSPQNKTKFGLHFFQNDTQHLGHSLVSGGEAFYKLINVLNDYRGLDKRFYGEEPKIFQNILENMDRVYFSSNPKVKKLLTVYIARGFEDGIELEFLNQVIEKSKKENIHVLFIEVHGFDKKARIFTLQELYNYVFQKEDNINKLKNRDMPEDLGTPLDLNLPTDSYPPRKKRPEKRTLPKEKNEEDIDDEKRPIGNTHLT
jgi:hypothetical protein